MNEQLIETLQKWNEKLIQEGYVPTIELLIEKLKEEDVKLEAERLTINND